MGYKTISIDNSSWTGTSFADNVYINSADKVRVNTAGGNDSIYNYYGWYETIDAGDGNDTIKSYRGNGSSIVGGAGVDLISLSGDAVNITVKGGTGNDVIYGDSAAQIFQYASGDGNDLIYNWSANDTISITGAQGYERLNVGNDVLLKVGNSAITLKGAKGKTVNVKGNWEYVVDGGERATIGSYTSRNINNTTSNKTVNGTSYNDTIKNTSSRVTINAGAGNDIISNNGYVENVSINAGAGNDSVYTYNTKYVTVLGGDGNDTIFNDRVDDGKTYAGGGNDVINNIVARNYIDAGDGNDRISLSGGYGGNTVVGGTGNDTIYGDKGAQFFRYASGDGNDVIYNWSANDTISITGGNYMRSTVGSDVVLKVGNGAVTLKGAKNTTVNVKGTLASGGGSTIPVTQPSGNVIYGTNGHDSIRNYSTAGAVIYTYDGNDTVRNSKNNVYISGGAGNDSIDSDGNNVTITGDTGHDNIYSYGANVQIYGGANNDSIYIVRGDNGYIDGGADNDTIAVWSGTNLSLKGGASNDSFRLYSNASCVIAYNSGDGNDTVTGFDGNDTLKVYGSYTRSTVGNDVVVKVGYGSITLKNAKNSTLNISNLASSADLVGSADLASDDWISADDTNFVTGDTQIYSIVKPVADYSVSDFEAASMSLTPKNNFLTFASKK